MTRLPQTITYLSPLDALIAITKRLSLYENQYKLDSEEFFHQYRQGKTSDKIEFIEIVRCNRAYIENYDEEVFAHLGK
jgi:hypothetical protein